MSLPFGKNKNNRLLYYAKAIARELMPSWLFRIQLKNKLTAAHSFDADYIKERVNYYNKLSETRSLSGETDFLNKLSGIKIISGKSVPLSQFKLRNVRKKRVYYFDSYEYTRYFNPTLKLHYMFGDVTAIPDEPTIVKSRPVRGDNANSVVLNLEKFRHFLFLNDPRKFSEKKNMLVGRAVVKQPHRIRFFEKYFDHPLCDLGQTNQKPNPQWIKHWLSIADHLEYKFILCIEGNDVATNLKWVMSSNSLAVMPRPTYETWFMEGKLIPDYHYVALKDDYSDLEERLNYYLQHPEEAQKIINNAHAYIEQFKNKAREDYISLLVLEKYFYRTGQLTPISNPNLFA